MSIDLQVAPEVAEDVEVEFLDGIGPYNRDSVGVDAMVTIEGQTVEDWLRNSPPPRIREYIDGVVYMPSAPSNEHQDLTFFMSVVFELCRRDLGLGRVRVGPAVVQLTAERYLMPDVFVLPAEGTTDPPPALLVVEVLSKSTRHHDLVRKAKLYSEAGIPEYLCVDMKSRVMHVARLVDGSYQFERVFEGFWRSTSCPGLWLKLGWLWDQAMPDPQGCQALILAGPPT